MSDFNQRDQGNRPPLINAAIDNSVAVTKSLLEAGAHVNSQDSLGNSALHYAAQAYFPEIAAILIRNGATVDIQDQNGNTPLWRAIFNSRGRGELVTMLLKAGANKNLQNKHGKSPLELARSIGNYDVAQFLN